MIDIPKVDLPKFLVQKSVSSKVVMVGIASLTLLMIVGLLTGHDGVLLSTTIGIIALAIGVVIPAPRMK